MFLIAPKFSPVKRCFTTTFRSPGFTQKINFASYDDAIIAALAFYLPKDTILAAAEKALSRDQLRIRNLRVAKFERDKRRQDEANV